MKKGSVTFIAVFVEWLNQVAPQEHSLLQRSLKQWEISLCSYLVAQGRFHEHVTTYLNVSQSPRQHHVADPRIPAFRQVYRTLQDAYDDRTEYDKDIWDVRKLSSSLNASLCVQTELFPDRTTLASASSKRIPSLLFSNSRSSELFYQAHSHSEIFHVLEDVPSIISTNCCDAFAHD